MGGWDGGWCGWVVVVHCYCLDPRGVVLDSRTEWPRTPQCDGQSPCPLWVWECGREGGREGGRVGVCVGGAVDCYCSATVSLSLGVGFGWVGGLGGRVGWWVCRWCGWVGGW